MAIYAKGFIVAYKNDLSLLTEADTRANEIICKEYPPIPLLSEENTDAPCEERKAWEFHWCIDTLYGTKEFVNKTASLPSISC